MSSGQLRARAGSPVPERSTDGQARLRQQEFERRTEAVRELLERRGERAALLTGRRNFAWLTVGGQNHVVLASEDGASSILVTPREVTVLAPINEADRIRDEELAELAIEVVALPWHDPEAIAREAASRSGASADSGGPADDGVLEADLMPLRARLGPLDHDRLRWLGRTALRALEATLAGLGPGTTEDDAAAQLLPRVASEGVRAPVLLVAADQRIERYRHPLPTGAPIHRRVMVVLVAERWGLHAAVTRFRELEPPSGPLARRIAATAEVQATLHEATRVGRTLGDVFDAGRSAYAATGFPDEWRFHHQGGTIAYQGRERIVVPGDPTPIEAGMAFAWNPSINGTKAEDTFLLGEESEREIITG